MTVDQALEDVVQFANNFTLPSDASAISKLKSPDALHASKTPWIFIGGSYPGMRAANIRVRNPETIFASWASSGIVQSSVGQESYWRTVAQHLPGNCSSDYAAAVQFFDTTMTGSDEQLKTDTGLELVSAQTGVSVEDLKVKLDASGQSSTPDDPQTIAKAGLSLSVPLNSFQDLGPSSSIQTFCDALETAAGRSAPSDEGLAASHATGAEIFESFLAAIQAQKAPPADPSSATSTAGPTRRDDGSSSAPEDTSEGDALGWQWLTCNEIGFQQVADPTASTTIVSRLKTVLFMLTQCNATFPNMLPSSPQVDAINNKFGGWTQNPSRVMYTNGELDPWKATSVASTEAGAPMRAATTTVPPADGAPNNNSYYGVVYPGGVHASDLLDSPAIGISHEQAVQTGMTMFTAALDQWLPAFKPGNDPASTSSTSTTPGSESKHSAAGSMFVHVNRVSLVFMAFGVFAFLV